MSTETDLKKLKLWSRGSSRINSTVLRLAGSDQVPVKIDVDTDSGEVSCGKHILVKTKGYPTLEIAAWSTYSLARNFCSFHSISENQELYDALTAYLFSVAFSYAYPNAEITLEGMYLFFVPLPQVLRGIVSGYLSFPNHHQAIQNLNDQTSMVCACKGIMGNKVVPQTAPFLSQVTSDQVIFRNGTTFDRRNKVQVYQLLNRMRKLMRIRTHQMHLAETLSDMVFKGPSRKRRRVDPS